jgi:hypothetical protein
MLLQKNLLPRGENVFLDENEKIQIFPLIWGVSPQVTYVRYQKRNLSALFQQFTPSYLTINTSEGTVWLWHVLENSQQKKPPPGKTLLLHYSQHFSNG